MKTQNDILTELYKAAKASPIDGLTGGIYKRIRPTDSELEDCVLSTIGGVNGKFVQDGAILVKIFYKDKNVDNTYFEDTLRGGELEAMLLDFSTVLLKNNGFISFDVRSRQTYTEKFLEKNEHYAILRMNFKIAN
jgi:hypothetical protein